jgi:cytoskeletal protein CcmA (bactofilin family)
MFTIRDIIHIIVLILLILYIRKTNKETFAGTSDIANMDVSAIKSLSDIAQKLVTGGLTIPGDLNVTGKITTSGDLNVGGKQTIKGDLNVGGKQTTKGYLMTDNNVTFKGNANINGTLTVGNQIISKNPNTFGVVNASNLTVNQNAQFNCPVNILNKKGGTTHFNYGANSDNYIRGDSLRVAKKLITGTPSKLKFAGVGWISSHQDGPKYWPHRDTGHTANFLLD